MKKIRNLLFDLGGVVMDIRRSACVAAFRQLGMLHPEKFLGEYVQSGPFMGIEDGSMRPEEFRNALRPYLHRDVTDAEIDAAFMKFLIGIPARRLKELRMLREDGYRVCLLSNTNPIMWNGKITEEFRKEGKSGPEAYFDAIVRSYKVGVMKPAPEIFLAAEELCSITAGETVFIDDSQANLDAAAALGFDTLLVRPGDEFFPLLEERLQS